MPFGECGNENKAKTKFKITNSKKYLYSFLVYYELRMGKHFCKLNAFHKFAICATKYKNATIVLFINFHSCGKGMCAVCVK